MKIYEATIYDYENDQNEFARLAVMDTETEQRYYDERKYDKLFQNSGYRDDDIFYYINQSEIPGKNNGRIMPGDVYDYITIRNIRLVCNRSRITTKERN